MGPSIYTRMWLICMKKKHEMHRNYGYFVHKLISRYTPLFDIYFFEGKMCFRNFEFSNTNTPKLWSVWFVIFTLLNKKQTSTLPCHCCNLSYESITFLSWCKWKHGDNYLVHSIVSATAALNFSQMNRFCVSWIAHRSGCKTDKCTRAISSKWKNQGAVLWSDKRKCTFSAGIVISTLYTTVLISRC